MLYNPQEIVQYNPQEIVQYNPQEIVQVQFYSMMHGKTQIYWFSNSYKFLEY